MGLVVDREGNWGKLDRESNAEAIAACSAKTSDNPVVYQLVRVEGDGSLVPATDDELMEVEQLLEHDRNQMPSTEGRKHTERCFSTEVLSSKKSNSDCSEGLSHSDITDGGAQKLNSRLEYIEVILQKVKQEERQRLSCEPLLGSTNVVDVDPHSFDQNNSLIACGCKLPAENMLQDIVSHSTGLNGTYNPQLSEGETCSVAADKPFTLTELTSICSSKLDFSMLKGEACLDNLTIRELQQVFLTTYGRETTVKDKIWLKRRIAAGLTVLSKATASIDAKEKVAVLEELGHVDESKANIPYTDQATRSKTHNPNLTSQMDDVQVLSNKKLTKPVRENDTKKEFLHVEQGAAKRLRKPTKRFIEELSEAESRECSGRPYSSAKDCGSHNRQAGRKPYQDSIVGTRQDSLGGSDVLIPYVQRVRRGRPRRDLSTLMESCPMDKPTEMVIQGLYVGKHDGKNGSMICRARSIPMRIPQRNAVGIDRKRRALEPCTGENLEHGKIDSAVHNGSYSNINSAIASKYSARRKHHRAWSLSEVLKLIDGVATYGAGRWSEIKKVAFSSFTHRTSVDLKDKWRNLLRASLVQAPQQDMPKNIRKHSSTPLPLSILLRVRELAEIQSQSGTEISFTKSTGKMDTIQEKRSGFL